MIRTHSKNIISDTHITMRMTIEPKNHIISAIGSIIMKTNIIHWLMPADLNFVVKPDVIVDIKMIGWNVGCKYRQVMIEITPTHTVFNGFLASLILSICAFTVVSITRDFSKPTVMIEKRSINQGVGR